MIHISVSKFYAKRFKMLSESCVALEQVLQHFCGPQGHSETIDGIENSLSPVAKTWTSTDQQRPDLLLHIVCESNTQNVFTNEDSSWIHSNQTKMDFFWMLKASRIRP